MARLARGGVSGEQLAQGPFYYPPAPQGGVEATPSSPVGGHEAQVDRRRNRAGGGEQGVGQLKERVGSTLEAPVERVSKGAQIVEGLRYGVHNDPSCSQCSPMSTADNDPWPLGLKHKLRCVCCAYVGWYLAFCVPSHQALSSADRYGHKALVSGPHVVTVHVGRTVDVAQVKGAFVGIEDERATVVGEKVPGLRVVVVEEHVFGVGELHRDGVEVGVVGLQVSGDEHEILLLTRAGVDEEPHRAGAIAPVGVLLEDFVVGNMLWRLEVPDLCIPSIGSRPLCVFPFRPRGAYLLEGHGRRAHLRLLEGPYRLLCKPQREEDDGDEGQDQGRCTVQVRDSFGHSKSTTGSP